MMIHRLLLALLLLCSPASTASAASLTCNSTGSFSAADLASGLWDCSDADSPGPDDSFVITSGHTATITGAWTLGVGGSITVAGTLTADSAVDTSAALVLGDGDLAVSAGGTLNLQGAYVPLRTDATTPLADASADWIEAGRIIPCGVYDAATTDEGITGTGWEPDCAGAVTADAADIVGIDSDTTVTGVTDTPRRHVAIVWEVGPAAYGEAASGRPGYSFLSEDMAKITTGDVLQFFDQTPKTARAPTQDGSQFGIIEAGEDPDGNFYLLLDVLRTSVSSPVTAVGEYDLDQRAVFADTVAASNPVPGRGRWIALTDSTTFQGAAVGDDPIGRFVRFADASGQPQQDRYMIADFSVDVNCSTDARCASGTHDLMQVASIHGIPAVGAGTRFWIDQGIKASDEFRILRPFVVSTSAPISDDTSVGESVICTGSCVLDAVHLAGVRGVRNEGSYVASNTWQMDSCTSDKIFNSTSATLLDLSYYQQSGGCDMAARPAQFNHGIGSFADSLLFRARTLVIAHHNDDAFVNAAGSVAEIDARRVRVEYLGTGANSAQMLSFSGTGSGRISDLDCRRCGFSGGGALVSVPSGGSYGVVFDRGLVTARASLTFAENSATARDLHMISVRNGNVPVGRRIVGQGIINNQLPADAGVTKLRDSIFVDSTFIGVVARASATQSSDYENVLLLNTTADSTSIKAVDIETGPLAPISLVDVGFVWTSDALPDTGFFRLLAAEDFTVAGQIATATDRMEGLLFHNGLLVQDDVNARILAGSVDVSDEEDLFANTTRGPCISNSRTPSVVAQASENDFPASTFRDLIPQLDAATSSEFILNGRRDSRDCGPGWRQPVGIARPTWAHWTTGIPPISYGPEFDPVP